MGAQTASFCLLVSRAKPMVGVWEEAIPPTIVAITKRLRQRVRNGGGEGTLIHWKNRLRRFFGHQLRFRRQKAWFLPGARSRLPSRVATPGRARGHAPSPAS